jgi:hypothetical protein
LWSQQETGVEDSKDLRNQRKEYFVLWTNTKLSWVLAPNHIQSVASSSMHTSNAVVVLRVPKIIKGDINAPLANGVVHNLRQPVLNGIDPDIPNSTGRVMIRFARLPTPPPPI